MIVVRETEDGFKYVRYDIELRPINGIEDFD